MINVTQAALILGKTPDYVRKLIAAGRLRALKVGAWYVLDEREVRRFARTPQPRGGWPKGRPRGQKQETGVA